MTPRKPKGVELHKKRIRSLRDQPGAALPWGYLEAARNELLGILEEMRTSVTLVLFLPGKKASRLAFGWITRINRTGDLWHAFISGIEQGIRYGYRVERFPNPTVGFIVLTVV